MQFFYSAADTGKNRRFAKAFEAVQVPGTFPPKAPENFWKWVFFMREMRRGES